jgi:flavin reductase (DIM6/NTAB) family NADH-FMN oxidoreductase RutF
MNFADASAILVQINSPLWLVTACAGPRRGGLIATFVCKASLAPELPRVLVGLAKQHHTWELIEASDTFGLHLLDAQNASWVWQFGLRSGRELDKLSGLALGTGATGCPLMEDAAGWLDCRVEARLDAGDRTIYLAEVVEAKLTRGNAPLTLERLLQFANADQLEELRALERRDSVVDAQAILTWRRANGVMRKPAVTSDRSTHEGDRLSLCPTP